MLTQQEIENLILALVGAFALWHLQQLAKHVHVISAVMRLNMVGGPKPNPGPTLPVTNKELEAILDPAAGGRYARFSFPDSLRPFKE